MTLRRGKGPKKTSRVFAIEELDGFYVDRELDRTVHITFEEHDVLVIDVYDTAEAAYSDAGDVIGIVEVNLRTGKMRPRGLRG